jgi:DNA-binding CsgD family transcriptional regulator
MSLVVENYIKELYMILAKGDIESETFNNALSIEMAIMKLSKSGNLSRLDIEILRKVAEGFSLNEISNLLNIHRKRVITSFKKSCRKVAYLLGGDFTNDGFFEKHLLD